MSGASADIQVSDDAPDTHTRAFEESVGGSDADSVDSCALFAVDYTGLRARGGGGADGSDADSYDGSAFAGAECISAGSEDECLMSRITHFSNSRSLLPCTCYSGNSTTARA